MTFLLFFSVAAARVLRKPKHFLQKCPLLVSLLPELEPAANPDFEEEAPIDSIESEERPDENGALSDVCRLAIWLIFDILDQNKSRSATKPLYQPS